MFRVRFVSRAAGIGASLLVFAACSEPSIKTVLNPRANFSRYPTYAWASDTRAAREGAQPRMSEAIRSEVDRKLAARGLREVAPARADLIVSYSERIHSQVSQYGTVPTDLTPPQAPFVTSKDSLTLTFVDPRTHGTVWEGTATQSIRPPGATQHQLAIAARDIMKKFPAAEPAGIRG